MKQQRRASSKTVAAALFLALVLMIPVTTTVAQPGPTIRAGSPSRLDELRASFKNPPREFTQAPFWFWNGALTENGIIKQIQDMDEKGVHGFTIHARMGLSPEIGYMTERWLALVHTAVEEAAKRGMSVYLYDEGMYPSGSAHGKVVEGRPDLASQGLRMEEEQVSGPRTVEIGVQLGDQETLVAVVLMQKLEGSERLWHTTAKVLKPSVPARVDIPAGEWTVHSFVQTPSGGTIRGVHPDEEDGQPNAPKAADLLNPEATARFIAETHERYYKSLQEYFGSTIKGIFTDEPSMLGRGGRRGLQPWSGGLLERLNAHLGYDFASYLPFLFGKEAAEGVAEAAREDFRIALAEFLNEGYYRPLSEWCDAHGIALTGHPAGGGEMDPLLYFQHPGQDVVWRWVLPGPTSLEGEQSTLGKSASSMAVNLNRPVVINEAFGAYGWRLTTGEIKWLTDWLYVRGTNLLMPHAFYYSDEGDRLYERPPDLSWYNLWWEHYSQFSSYTNRLSWLMRGGTPVADIAILAIPGYTPWRTAKALFQSQRDFNYLSATLIPDVQVDRDRLPVGAGSYRVLVLDGLQYLTGDLEESLCKLADQGIELISVESQLQEHPLRYGKNQADVTCRLNRQNVRFVGSETALIQYLDENLPNDVKLNPANPDLRYAHRIKEGIHFYLVTNEGDREIDGTISFAQNTVPELWDAESGEGAPFGDAYLEDGRVHAHLALAPRTSKIFVFDPASAEAPPRGQSPEMPHWTSTLQLPESGWELEIGDRTFDNVTLGSWTKLPGLESFSGTGWYTIALDVPADRLNGARSVILDAGQVQTWATVEVNGELSGTRLWQPFRFDITDLLQPGSNTIRIGVTNTRSNEMTDLKMPSGLQGPLNISFK